MFDMIRIKSIISIIRYYVTLICSFSSGTFRLRMRGVRTYGPVIVKFGSNSTIQISSSVSFNSSILDNPISSNNYSSIVVKDNSKLTIGSGTSFSQVSIWCSLKITIGNNCVFGSGVKIWDTDFHNFEYGAAYTTRNSKRNDINISNNVFVGANSLILKGVRIGDNAIIGANSVIRCNVGDNEIWIGNPAIKIGLRKI